MSNKVSVLVYSRRVGSPIRKAVLVYFAERASDNGEGIWASKGSIAAAIECGRSTVIRTIQDFVSEGILVEAGKRSHRNGETIEYRMDLRAIADLPNAKDATAEPVPERDRSRSGTSPAAEPPPVPERDPYPSRSGTQTTIRTTIEPPEEPLVVPHGEKPEPKARLPSDWALSDEGWAYARSKNIPDEVIEDEARGFHAYWSDRRDRDACRSQRGWEQCWANRCRAIASRYQRGLSVAGKASPGGYGQGGSIASIAARRRAAGQV